MDLQNNIDRTEYSRCIKCNAYVEIKKLRICQCGKEICSRCTLVVDEHDFCSEKCIDKYKVNKS